MKHYDAILIPGGGVEEGGLLPSWVECRLNRALELSTEDTILIALSAGTTHRPPPLDAGGFPIFESVAAARYLIRAGVAPERILTETCSYDTIGNAFFSRVIHTDPRRLERLLVVTSDFHLARTEAVFRWVYNLEPKTVAYDLHFESVADPRMPSDLWRDRRQKEEDSLAAFAQIQEGTRTIEDCHRWLFTVHGAYHSPAVAFDRPAVDGSTLRSY